MANRFFVGDKNEFGIEITKIEQIGRYKYFYFWCPYCNQEKQAPFYKFKKYTSCLCRKEEKRKNTCLEKYGVKSPSQVTSIMDKRRKTCLDKYGYENPTESKVVIDKIKTTNVERRGCENAFQSKEVQAKARKTCLERYGVEHVQQNEEIQAKTRKTCLERHGVEYSLQSETIRNKAKLTNIEKYGVECVFQDEGVKRKIKLTNLRRYGVEFAIQNEKVKSKIRSRNLRKWGCENPFQNKDIKDKIREIHLERYGVEHVLQSEEIKARGRLTNLRRYGVKHVLQSEEIKSKIANTNLEKYGVKCLFQNADIKTKIKATNLKRYGFEHAIQNEKIRKKILGQSHNMSKPEKYIKEFLTNNHFHYESQYFVNGKMWDFGVFKDEKLHLLIEVDGEFFHGLNTDPYSKHQANYEYDTERMGKLPEGVLFLAIDSLKVKEGIKGIFKMFEIDYEQYIQSIYDKCFNQPFPFPHYSNQRMKKDWDNLGRSFTSRFARDNRTCNSIVTHFHPSIYQSNRKGYKSPVEAWNDPVLLRKCIENRVVYKGDFSSYEVARGFEKSRIAPRVSVFQPYWARFLLANFASLDTKVVGDPYSGYSGRLLGTTSLGFKYVGTDINPVAIQESSQIVNFLDIQNQVDLKCTDTFDQEVDCVLTCPPYDDTEKWNQEDQKPLEWHLDRILAIKAKEYLIVIPEKDAIRLGYQDKIVHVFTNKSHFGSNNEVCVKL